MNFLRRIHNHILRDVSDTNETKKTAVMIRFTAILMCFYFVIQTIAFAVIHLPLVTIVSVLFILTFAGLFYQTYQGRTQLAYGLMIGLSVAWILVFVYLIGWDASTQTFMFGLIVFAFVTGHSKLHIKFSIIGGLTALRLAMYFYTHHTEPVYQIDRSMIASLQIVNTLFVIGLLTLLSYLFSADSLSSEEKLLSDNKRARHLASVDPLTGLMNRRGMQAWLDELISTEHGTPKFINIAMGDIDLFKSVNDTYGHSTGDVVLKALADYFRQQLEGCGEVARWGGEEFLFVITGENGDQAMTRLEQLRSGIKKLPFAADGTTFHVSMTFGLEEYTPQSDLASAIEEADRKLYIGKTSGRDQVVF